MRIQTINNYQKTNSPQFKAVYPVRYWVAESNGSFNPVFTEKMAKELNNKMFDIFNKKRIIVQEKIKTLTRYCSEMTALGKSCSKEKAELKKYENIDKLQKKLAQDDRDYMGYPYIRGFYNENGGYQKDNIEPAAYFVTGQDTEYIEELGKKLGQSRSELPKGKTSAELERAKNDYWKKGFHFVKSKAKHFKEDVYGVPKELHVKLEAQRTSTGRIKGYNIVDFGFYPTKGKDNPFVITGWLEK